MSMRFVCGCVLLGAFVASVLGLIIFKHPWISMGGLVVTVAAAAVFFFQSLEE
ncbi:MAG: hypothetical protein Q7R71_01085 [bacterium]|nr:hypothetical protein [bacterium]